MRGESNSRRIAGVSLSPRSIRAALNYFPTSSCDVAANSCCSSGGLVPTGSARDWGAREAFPWKEAVP